MSQAVSIHIGVNDPRPADPFAARARLADSEAAAWRMAELASQAGYGSMLVLRGQTATLAAVNAALWNVSQLLAGGDTLLVTFSGHGGQVPDQDAEDPHGSDESWSLHDGELLDDTLCGYWRLFKAGVRIVVVSESCYSGGMMRSVDEEELLLQQNTAAAGPRRMRDGGMGSGGGDELPPLDAPPGWHQKRGEPAWQQAEVRKTMGPTVVEPFRDPSGVRATVLMLTASSETQPAQAGLFTDCLLEVWAGGAFPGSYRELFDEVKRRVMRVKSDQEPQILMLGAPDPAFPQAPAFRPQPGPAAEGSTMRDGGGGPVMRGG
ncbi:MAG TPA: caspase family protein [Longimicrobium sp.]|nr:caspase family protein [Longimicrobium sp.]